MTHTLKKKQLLLLAFCILLCAELCACGPSLIPPSEEVISPSEHQQVEYIAKPPGELGTLLFSYQLSEQQRQNNWNECRGKWVVWSGTVLGLSPKLKPSKGVFSYDYEVPLLYAAAGEFGVVVDFQPQWTEYLGQLSEGETVHYRAKLAQRNPLLLYEAARYGISPDAGFLELKDAEILHEDDVAARLADFTYTTYDQLDELVEDAEKINSIKQFFEEKVELGKKQIVIEQILKLFNVDISDKSWLLEERPLNSLRAQKYAYRQDIEWAFQATLLSLHPSSPQNKQSCLKNITDALNSNELIAETCGDIEEVWEDYYEQEKEAAQPDIGDLLTALLFSKLHPILKVAKGVVEGSIESGELDAYQIAVRGCIASMGYISDDMEYIRNNALEVIHNVKAST